jgi:hypothetical protein
MEYNGEYYTEDDYREMCELADYWGDDCLTEDEQYIVNHFPR